MRYLINFSYDGSKFHGFQRQEGLKTVQEKIEKALTDLDKNKVSIHASGRTDKGVHAKNQYAHFDLEKNVKLYNLKKYLNSSFDGEIYIKSVENELQKAIEKGKHLDEFMSEFDEEHKKILRKQGYDI